MIDSADRSPADRIPDDLSGVDVNALMRVRSWQAKYKLLMTWSNAICVKPWLRRDEYLVRGCDTSLWLCHWRVEGKFFFAIDADSRIIKGLAMLLIAQINGATAETIKAADLGHLLARLGVSDHLAPSRNNGFLALLNQIERWVFRPD